MPGKTLYDKLWDSHVVREEDDGTSLIYIDRHLIHEVTSPQAFAALKQAERLPRRVGANLAVADHNVPTTDRTKGISDAVSQLQVTTLDQNCKEFGITEYDMNDLERALSVLTFGLGIAKTPGYSASGVNTKQICQQFIGPVCIVIG